MRMARAQVGEADGSGTRMYAMVDALNRKSTVGITIRLVLLIAPPAFYAQVRSPASSFLPRPSLAFYGLL